MGQNLSAGVENTCITAVSEASRLQIGDTAD